MAGYLCRVKGTGAFDRACFLLSENGPEQLMNGDFLAFYADVLRVRSNVKPASISFSAASTFNLLPDAEIINTATTRERPAICMTLEQGDWNDSARHRITQMYHKLAGFNPNIRRRPSCRSQSPYCRLVSKMLILVVQYLCNL